MTDSRDTGAARPMEAGVVDAAALLSFAMHDILNRVAASQQLSLTQLRLLGILRDRTPGMAVLAEYLGLDRSSVTGLIDRAESRGLVRRQPSPTDRRSFQVALTPEGRQVAHQLEGDVATAAGALLAGTGTADRAALIRIAGALPDRRSGQR